MQAHSTFNRELISISSSGPFYRASTSETPSERRGVNQPPTEKVILDENTVYLEACRQLAYEEGENSVCFVALTYVLEPGALGEQKSKAAQLGIKRLMEVGIMPHIIACRATNPVKEKVREKISMYTNVPMKRVVTMHDVESIYFIPDALREQAIDREVLGLLDLHGRVNQKMEDRERIKW